MTAGGWRLQCETHTHVINIGYLVSYDAPLLFESLRHVYDYADSITLAIDARRRTYGGETFALPDAFFETLASLDHRRIVNCYEDDFFVPGLTAMEMEVRERHLLSRRMGRGWCVQLDVDEYVYGFAAVADCLRAHAALTVAPWLTPVAVRGEWVTLFKAVDGGMLYIDAGEPMTLATSLPHFTYGRGSPRTWKHHTGVRVIHQSWARSHEEVRQKCRNWSHREEGERFFDLWQSVTRQNYRSFRRFHPRRPDTWPRLRFLECRSVEDFVDAYAAKHPQQAMAMTWSDAGRSMRRGLRGLLDQSGIDSSARVSAGEAERE